MVTEQGTALIERSWLTIGEMAPVILIHHGVEESVWEEAILFSAEFNYRVTPARGSPSETYNFGVNYSALSPDNTSDMKDTPLPTASLHRIVLKSLS